MTDTKQTLNVDLAIVKTKSKRITTFHIMLTLALWNQSNLGAPEGETDLTALFNWGNDIVSDMRYWWCIVLVGIKLDMFIFSFHINLSP